MMKYVFLIIAAFSFNSCVTYTLVPLPSSEIEIIESRGESIPVYSSDKIGMAIIPDFNGNEIMIKLIVKNLSEDLINIKDSDFSVEESYNLSSWRKVKVFTSKEYYTKERNSYIVGQAIMALGALANASSAGRRTLTTSGSVYGTTSYGSYSGFYNATTTYYDPVAAQLANQQYSQMIAHYSANERAWLDFLYNNLFYAKTLSPGEEYYGLIFAKRGSGKYYRITFNNKKLGIVSIRYVKE